MRATISVLPAFLFVLMTAGLASLSAVASAEAGAALPRVDVARSVSARAMYGEAPVAAQPQQTANSKQQIANNEVVTRAATNPAPVSQDVLTPRRPSENLWAQPKDAPLRMPLASEIAVMNNNAYLPEESLDASSFARALNPVPAPVAQAQKVALRPAPPPQRIVETVVERVIDEEAMARAYEAGRIAELQRIADKALVDRATGAKTRQMVVPMDDRSQPSVASVRSVKMSPVREETVAYRSADDTSLTKLSPMQLKRAFKKTYVSENKHLSAYKAEDRFDSIADEDVAYDIQGFDSIADMSERGDIRPLEIKLSFRGNDAALSRDNYMLLSEYAGIVVGNPKRAVQIAIPERAVRSFEGKRLAAKRLAIIEQVLRDTGVSDYRIVPVLADRNDDALVLRVISNEMFQSLTQKRGKESVTSRSLSW